MPGVPTLYNFATDRSWGAGPFVGLAIVTAFSQRKKLAPYPVGSRPRVLPLNGRFRPPALENFHRRLRKLPSRNRRYAIQQAPESAASATGTSGRDVTGYRSTPATPPTEPRGTCLSWLCQAPRPSGSACGTRLARSRRNRRTPNRCRAGTSCASGRRAAPNRRASQSVSASACARRARISSRASAPRSPAAREPTKSTKVLRKL